MYRCDMQRSSMQCKIPEDMRAQLADDPFMQWCILRHDGLCKGRVQWQHAFKYAGKRQNELWGILPMCEYHHEHQAEYIGLQEDIMRLRIHDFDAVDDVHAKYPKSTLI